METPAFQKSLKGVFVWFLWKIGFVIYVLSSALPMIGFITSLFVIAIKREADILICVVMLAMLHPIVNLIIGVLTKTIGQFLSSKFSMLYKHKIVARLFTYSINYHFAMIAALTLYLYEMWMTLRKLGLTAGLDFSNESYDQCTCDILKAKGIECTNTETDYNFQNLFLTIPVRILLLVFLTTSVSCHLIQSIFECLPAPIQLLHFIIGKEESRDETFKKESGSLIEMENLNGIGVPVVTNKPKTMKWKQVLSCTFAVVFFTGIVGSPFYGFGLFSEKVESSRNGNDYICLCRILSLIDILPQILILFRYGMLDY